MLKSGVFKAEYDTHRLEHYSTILRYFGPELVNAILVYTLMVFVDAQLVAGLKSTTAYAMVGITNTLMFFITKVAEGLSVGAVILCGQYEGRQEYSMVGKSAVAAVWATLLVGAAIAGFLYAGAPFIFSSLLCVPDEMVAVGVPFLRLRTISVFLMFIFFALIGFLRGVKNTKAIMYFYLLGAAVFIIADYALIHGNLGFAAYGFNGSALASIMQYGTMLFAALIYILSHEEYRQYHFPLKTVNAELVRRICSLSWPVMFDKATLQLEKIWMVRLISPMGAYALSGLNVIKDLESLAFLPVVAFGHIVTLLVSNEYGAKNDLGIKLAIKRTIAMASMMMFSLLLLFALKPVWFISLFDKQNLFTDFAAKAFPFVGILTFFDLLQLILAGALRGTGQVKVVMLTRVITALVLFMPLSYAASLIPVENSLIRFIAIYGSFNIINGVASVIYYVWFHAGYWRRAS